MLSRIGLCVLVLAMLPLSAWAVEGEPDTPKATVSFLQITSILLALAGTWLLAFGLKIKRGMSSDIEKQLPKRDDLATITDVRNRPALLYCGLALITLAGLLQIWITIFSR